jgi:hypothetical protein
MLDKRESWNFGEKVPRLRVVQAQGPKSQDLKDLKVLKDLWWLYT